MTSSTRRFLLALIAALALATWLVPSAAGAAPALPAGTAAHAPAATLAAPAAQVGNPAAEGNGAYPGHRGAWHPLLQWSDGVTTNTAYATNTSPDHLRARTRMALVRTDDDIVSATNTATALASCVGCRTIAVAIEVVLAGGEPPEPGFDNEAVALNLGCAGCETLAMAYQLAVVSPGVDLSEQGVVRLRTINREVAAVVTSGTSLDQIAEGVASLAGEAQAVVEEELTTTGAAGPASAARGRAAAPAHPPVRVRSFVSRG